MEIINLPMAITDPAVIETSKTVGVSSSGEIQGEEMKCFIDMDGVLADFVGAACRAHNRPWPYDDPKNLGTFEIEPAWGITPREFWKPIDALGMGFWEGLEKTEESDRIVKLAIALYGITNVCVLTSPSEDPGCVPGKRAWLKKHYPELGKNVLFGSAKHFVSGKDRLLIDDRDKNIEDFEAYGGTGILVPRPWNRGFWWADPMGTIIRRLAETVLKD